MASPFAEAITQSMIAGLDPMNGVVKQYAGQMVQRSELELDEQRIQTMIRLQKLIEDGKENGIDGNVLDAYVTMLRKYTK